MSCSNFPNCNAAGATVELVEEKFRDQPKTPYVAKKKAAGEPKVKKKAPAKKKATKREPAKKKKAE